MQLFQLIKLNYALHLLKNHWLKFVDVWYYDPALHKECIMTFVPRDIKHWKKELINSVKQNKYKITYIYLGDTAL